MALQTTRLTAVQEESKIEDEIVILSLTSYIKRCYEEAKSAKSDMT